jgi:AcrR family transcriptional regulator
MRTIQDTALDLFDERGFDAVTIEEIAASAEVSASSVYRYFGTKEGLVVADEFDQMTQEALDGILDISDPVGSLLQIVRTYESAPRSEDNPHRRVRYMFQEPAVRRAACTTLDRASQRIAPMFAAGGMSMTQARVAANALVFGYFAALEQWYLDGCVRPIAAYVEDGMRLFRPIWPEPPAR